MTPHKYAEVIKAWADGAEIQVRPNQGAEWINSVWYDCVDAPTWGVENEYRIKPKPKMIRYRMGFMQRYDGYLWINVAMTEEEALCIQGSTAFQKWLGDWQEVEV